MCQRTEPLLVQENQTLRPILSSSSLAILRQPLNNLSNIATTTITIKKAKRTAKPSDSAEKTILKTYPSKTTMNNAKIASM